MEGASEISIAMEGELSLPDNLERQIFLGNSLIPKGAESDRVDPKGLIDGSSDEQIIEKNRAGNIALHVAARSGSLDLVEKLVKRMMLMPNVHHQNWMLNNDHNTPLHEAVLSRNCEVIRHLLDVYPEPLFWKNKQGKSALYLAVETGHVEILNLLLEFVPDEHASKVRGKSPVHAAIVYERLEMLEAKAKKKRLFHIKSMTALHLAAFMDYLPAVMLLLKEFPNFALRDDYRGYLPIHVACKEGRVRVVRELLKFCKNPMDLLNKEGQSIIHVAAKYGRSSVVKILLRDPRLGQLVNLRDDDGNTALHLAAKYWQPATLLALTWDQRVDVGLTNNKCETAYDVACHKDSKSDFLSMRQWYSFLVLSSAGAKGSRDLLLRPKDLDELHPSWKLLRPPALDQMKDTVGTQLVVAALKATVTFAAGFTMPGGFDGSETSNKGLAVIINRRMFQAFIICDTKATYAAILVVGLLLWTQANSDPYAFSAIYRLSIVPLYVALLAMSGAFMAGIYPVLGKLPWLRNAVLVMGIIFITVICSLSLVGFVPLRGGLRCIRIATYHFLLWGMLVSGSNKWRSPILRREEGESSSEWSHVENARPTMKPPAPCPPPSPPF